MDDIEFNPEYLKMGGEMFRRLKETTPEDPGPITDPAFFGLRVVVDSWMPDGFIAVVGPPKDRSSLDPLDWLPQVRMIHVEVKA